MSTLPKGFVTPEEYVALERKAEFKSEYYKGERFAMSGASRRHNWLGTRLTGLIEPRFRDRSCEIYASEMRVLVESAGLYLYPISRSHAASPDFRTTSSTRCSIPLS